VFDEVAQAREPGWLLVALTTSDRNLIDASFALRRCRSRAHRGVEDRLLQPGAW
jgi:hypothetical protein